jgi:putative trna/rrna methyltransferase protein
VYATSLNNKAINVCKANFNFPLCLIMGNEEKGVSNTLLNISDQNVYIPQSGEVQSLNVSVATAIMLYEINKKLGENNE